MGFGEVQKKIGSLANSFKVKFLLMPPTTQNSVILMHRKIYAALIHYPVVDKQGMLVSTSVTNLDVHDISRSARTYGVDKYYLVTPIEAQHWLISKILEHWESGWGSRYNANRKDALSITRCCKDIGELGEQIEAECGQAPIFVVTSARTHANTISFSHLKSQLAEAGPPVVLLFGTGWGLHSDIMAEADLVLEPISGTGDFNHLSVRAAAAIIFDRLLAKN